MIFFVAIMASIAIELSFRFVDGWRRFEWFAQFTDWVNHQLSTGPAKDGPVVVIAVLAPILIAIGLTSFALDSIWGLLDFAFSVLILVLSLGPIDPIRQAQNYVKALQGHDSEAAKVFAGDMLGRDVSESPVRVAEDVKQALFIRTCSGIIGVMIWFIILGPIGAAMFRLSCQLNERFGDVHTGFARSVNDLYNILMYVPTRVTVLCFALVGNFVDVVHAIQQTSGLWRADNETLLMETGVSALHERELSDDEKVNDEHINDCLLLAKRSVVAFITMLGVIIIVSWLV